MADSIDVEIVDTLINRMTDLGSLCVMQPSIDEQQVMNDYLKMKAMAQQNESYQLNNFPQQNLKAFRCYSPLIKTPSSNNLKSMASPDSGVFLEPMRVFIETNKQPRGVGQDQPHVNGIGRGMSRSKVVKNHDDVFHGYVASNEISKDLKNFYF